MKNKKPWHAITPEMFRAGRIELHTHRSTLIKNLKANGAHCEPDFLKDCAGCCYYSPLYTDSVMYIYVGDGQLSTLIHECFHASVRYLAWVGVPLEHDEPNETYAFFLEYLVKEFNPVLKV